MFTWDWFSDCSPRGTHWRSTLVLIGYGTLPIIAALIIAYFRPGAKTLKTSRVAATNALKQIEEWAKWMSGIQTALAGGLIALIFRSTNDGTPGLRLGFDKALATAVVFSMGAAILCTASVLFSLPCQSLSFPSTKENESGKFDIFEQRLFEWLPNIFTIGFVMTFQSVLFTGGLVLAGILIVRQLP